MSNETLQKPPRHNARSRASNRNTQFKRQTARLEGRRDGKPLLFGWGGHLTKAQKLRFQTVAAFSFLGVVIGAVILAVVLGILNQNVFIPNKTFLTVNGVTYTQDQYRKTLAYEAQTVWNKLQIEIHQMNDLQTKVQQGDAAATTQNQIITAQIQTDEVNLSAGADYRSDGDADDGRQAHQGRRAALRAAESCPRLHLYTV